MIGDTLVAQGQVRMADIQTPIGASSRPRSRMQVEVAELAAPDRVVAEAIADGIGGTGPGRATSPRSRSTSRSRCRRRRRPGSSRRPHRTTPARCIHRRTTAHGEPRRPPQPAHPRHALLLVAVFLVMVLRLVQVQEFGNQHYAALSRPSSRRR